MPELETEPPEPVKDHPVFNGGTFGIATAERPKFKAELHGENQALEQHLNKLGLKYERVKGHYDEPEHSFIIHNPTRSQMYDIGKRFGQETAIFSEGGRHQMMFTNGPQANTYVTTQEPHNSYFAEKPENYYTEVPGGRGHFRLNFDWSKNLPLEINNSPSPDPINNSNLSGNLIGKHENMPSSTPVTVTDLKAALLERLKKAEAGLIELAKKENLGKGLPGQNPSLPNPTVPNVNGPSESPVGSGNEVPVGQLGPEGQASMETGGGTCPLCGQEDVPGKCTCLQSSQPVQAAPQPLAMAEKGFKRAWADYDKRAKTAKKSHMEKGDAPIGPVDATSLNQSEKLTKKPPNMPTGSGDVTGAAPMAMAERFKKDVPPTVPDISRGGGATLAQSEPLCKDCGKIRKMCKCVAKTDFVDQDTNKTVEKGVIGKRPGAASSIKEMPSANGKVVPNKFAVKKAEADKPSDSPLNKLPPANAPKITSRGRAVGGLPAIGPKATEAKKGEPEQSAEELNRLPPANAPKITSRGRAVGGLPAVGPKGVKEAKKAEPPMAKPPSGKNPATMTPTAKPAAAGAMPKPVVAPKSPVSAPKAGIMGKGELDKAALAPNMAAQAKQHGLIAGSQAAAAGGAPSLPQPSPKPLNHPANMGRANAMQQALQGAFAPKGPISSGLELARPAPGGLRAPPPGIRKSEADLLNYGCPLCGKPDHFGDC